MPDAGEGEAEGRDDRGRGDMPSAESKPAG